MLPITPNIMLQKLYYSRARSYDTFTVDVMRGGVVQRGYVTDIAEEGLIIDFHHYGPSATELVEFSCIRTLPTKKLAAYRYLKLFEVNSEVEVLVRSAVDQPLTWRKATFVALVPEYGTKRASEEGEQYFLVRLQSRNPFSLAAVANLWPPIVASDIRIRQKRLWQTVAPKTFFKVTVPHALCRKTDCPFPQSPLLYYIKNLDVDMKLAWLNTTGTLIVSADDGSVTVLCRKKSKRLPFKFHRLIFHLYDEIVEQYFRKGDTTRMETWFTTTIEKLLLFPKWLAAISGALLSKGIAQDLKAFPKLQTLPDILLLETLQSMDRISQRDLKCVCRRWYRLQSSATTEKCLTLEAPDVKHNHPLYLAKALLNYTFTSTRSLLLMQFSPSHSYTVMRLIKEMQLQLEFYASYRSTDTVHHRSVVSDLEDELAMYPAVNNLHISCVMKSKNANQLTLEIIMAAPEEMKCLLNHLGVDWTYCCTTKIMKDTVTGISRVLDALNLRCSVHGNLSDAVECPNHWQWKGGERLKNDLQRWPVSSAAFDALTKGFEHYCPPSRTLSYCEITAFRPEILKVLIRKPRLIGEEYFDSCGVESWLRFS
ncbi:uncharacterized protein LOC129592550 [Paramacrobiotus metropolitanus]|uniref:uncharacterized protein LOC129592550 n=1 Tax=Paramacrobiotus metropolitanus TaxID=2943436 RepID=UPI0024465176|nr:uncharacterized protein LOC129592550 [Paramacrobiotus metropolitanus]